MAVRWYFRYRLSAANVCDLLDERGMDVSRQTVADWVQKFSSPLAEAARRYTKRVSSRWYVTRPTCGSVSGGCICTTP